MQVRSGRLSNTTPPATASGAFKGTCSQRGGARVSSFSEAISGPGASGTVETTVHSDKFHR